MILLQFLVLLGLTLGEEPGFEILALSDIHLDTKFNPESSLSSFCRDANDKADLVAPYGRFGCDTPQLMLTSVLNQAVR